MTAPRRTDGADPTATLDRAPVVLRAKPLPINTFQENLVLLSRGNHALRPERLRGTRKVEISARGRSILASVVIAEDDGLVGIDEAGLTQPAFRRLGINPGEALHIAPARPPRSLDWLRAKIAGEPLDAVQMAEVVRDLVAHRWSDMETAAFLVACAGFMTADETLFLTEAMIGAGAVLTWGDRLVVDKHCVGGIPGNRTSLITVPIVAAHGLLIPKTSSRAITSPAGTADTMEVLARVDLDESEMRAVVEKCGGCVVWGGRVNLSPADDVLIAVERPLSLDTPEQMVASILSKKAAAGSNHLLIDLPVGPTAKIRDRASAQRLRKLFEYVAGRLGVGVELLITDGSAPIGRGVGPVLEARDVRAVLDNDPGAPAALREKAILLAGRLIEADPDVRGGQGEKRARELLENGEARRKMDAITEAQGPSPLRAELGPKVHEVAAPNAGRVAAIDCLRIATIARLAGAPTDAGAGIELLKQPGDAVSSGEPIFRIYGLDPSDFAFAVEAADEACGITVAP